MNEYFRSVILQATGASSLTEKEIIQELWSGYGTVRRAALKVGTYKSVVVKNIQLAADKNHPRGWNGDIGHQRKLTSYKLETTWYDRYSQKSLARLPECLAIEKLENEVLIVLEDLDATGFPLCKQSLSWDEIVSLVSRVDCFK